MMIIKEDDDGKEEERVRKNLGRCLRAPGSMNSTSRFVFLIFNFFLFFVIFGVQF